MGNEKIRVGFNGKFESKDVAIAPGDPAPWDPSHKFSILGSRVPRLDGVAKVSGQARYSIDVRLPGMLYGKILRSPHPAAVVTSIDLEAARKMPGVKAALPIAKAGEPVRYAGQAVAAVAAETAEQAFDALSSIRVEYETRPFVVDVASARKSGAPLVFAGQVESKASAGDMPGAARPLPRDGNVQGPRKSDKGSIDEGFQKADVLVESTYVTQVQTHTALETHGLVAAWEPDGSLKVWASTQGIFTVRDELADVFGLDKSKVHVTTEYMGGGFGAKFGAGVEGVAAARLAKEAGAPVKLFLDRKEEHLAVGNRPSAIQWIKAGATKDGKLTALHLVVHGNGGTNGGTGTSGPLKNVYECDNVRTEEFDVFTNSGPSAAFRAPGHPQGSFALEAMMDELAGKLGMDPLDFRMKNDPSEVRREEFRLGAERIGWKNRDARRATKDPAVRRGIGMGAAIWYNTGGTGPRATVTIHRDGSADVEQGVQDLGTGARTMVGIVAAEELGLPLEKINVRIGSSAMPFGPASGGSTTTPSSAPSIRAAAWQAKQKIAEVLGYAWNVAPEQIEIGSGVFAVKGDASKKLSWKAACAKLPESGVSATASRAENHGDAWKRFTAGAQFAEVEVDTETGRVQVKRVVAVHDCGLVVNALTTESQVQGGIIQGISYALYEDRVLDRPTGKMVNANVEQYKIAGASDVPEIETILLPVWDGVNNTHSVGIGEPATVATAGAVANAVSHAIGARIRRLPITPEVVLEALREAGAGKGGQA
ncbi:MAG TPA: xanthine dehydrogenase family protein molybdopterin-binding subunit [Thermoanaerobaculia bacterium]|nr:xanthine dehydrogenase family protein molybdopterin-binding subunit [Thermoanaerobaculia bacterium]